MATKFDPYAVLQALERQRVVYVVVGGLGRVLQGSDELTDGIDIVPLLREDNLRLLERALEDLKARRADGKPLALERDLARLPVLELATAAGRAEAGAGASGDAGAMTICAGTRSGSRSGRDCDPRLPRSTTTRACSPPSTETRTANPC